MRGTAEQPVSPRGSESIQEGPIALLPTSCGDASAASERAPYDMSEVSRRAFSVSGVAQLIAQLGTSRMLAPLGVVAAAFVIGGWWPHPRDRRR